MYKRNDERKRRNASKTRRARVAASVILVTFVLAYWQLSTTILSHYNANITNNTVRVASHEFVHPQPLQRHHPSSNNNNSTLEFVHITKTGGTAIERAAARAGILWGVCHYEVQRDTCFNMRPDLGWPQTFPLRSDIPYPNFTIRAEYWHTPPHWFVNNPYADKDTFVVVRNPYDRYISEFYCRYYGYYKKQPIGSNNRTTSSIRRNNPADRLAQFQQLEQQKQAFQARQAANTKQQQQQQQQHGRRLSQQDTTTTPREIMNEWILEKIHSYQGRTGHLLPQHYYVFDSRRNQVVTHVLKFESLSNDFETLMKQYNLPVMLSNNTDRVNEGLYYATENRLTWQDLFPETIHAINDFCRQDFDLFGYDMM